MISVELEELELALIIESLSDFADGLSREQGDSAIRLRNRLMSVMHRGKERSE